MEYHNQIWTWFDLLMAIRGDTKRVILAQVVLTTPYTHRENTRHLHRHFVRKNSVHYMSHIWLTLVLLIQLYATYCNCQSNGMISWRNFDIATKEVSLSLWNESKSVVFIPVRNPSWNFIDDIHVHVGTSLFQSHMAIIYIFFIFTGHQAKTAYEIQGRGRNTPHWCSTGRG